MFSGGEWRRPGRYIRVADVRATGLRWAASAQTHPFAALSRPAPRSHKMRSPGLAGGALDVEILPVYLLKGKALLEEHDFLKDGGLAGLPGE